MSESPDRDVQPPRVSQEVWDLRIVPTARACVRFFWELAWFVLILCLLFSFNPFR